MTDAPSATLGGPPSAAPSRGRGGGRGRGGRGRGGGGRGRARGDTLVHGNHNRHGRSGPRHHRHHIKSTKEREPLPNEAPGAVDDVTQDHAPTNQRLVNAAKDAKKRNARTTSQFHDLCAALPDPSSIAAYVAKEHESTLRMSKDLNRFLQAISGRSSGLYAELFTSYKPTVVAILERLADQCSGKEAVVYPPAHEWVLRCEQHGVKKASWIEGVALLGGASTLLMQPKELLAKVVAADPQGYMLRRIALAASCKGLIKSAQYLTAEGYLDAASVPNTSIALGRLVSKARRVLGHLLNVSQAAAGDKSEGKDVDAVDATTTETEAMPTEPESVEALQGACTVVVEASKHVIDRLRSAGATGVPLPIPKIKHLLEWAKAQGLLEEHLDAMAGVFHEDSVSSMERQANQMEVVIKVKSATSEAALMEVLAELVDEERAESEEEGADGDVAAASSSVRVGPLKLRSPDVLSSVAVAASGAEISVALKARVMRILVATAAADDSLQLPRRALTFIAAEKNRIRQEKRAQELKKRAREDDHKGADDE